MPHYLQESIINFVSAEHQNFYETQMLTKSKDSYNRVLFYTLGMCENTRRNINRLYDATKRCILSGAINEGWQTSTSMKVTRLAFNLFTDSVSVVREESSKSEIYTECSLYSVSDIFCCEYAPYFVEAIRLRYPEYMRGDS